MAKTTSSKTISPKIASAPKRSSRRPTRGETPQGERQSKSTGKTVSKPPSEAPAAGAETTKAARCIHLLRQPGGTTLQELMAVTGWQAHSVRGFLSGTVRRRMGLALASAPGENKVRRYHLTGEAT